MSETKGKCLERARLIAVITDVKLFIIICSSPQRGSRVAFFNFGLRRYLIKTIGNEYLETFISPSARRPWRRSRIIPAAARGARVQRGRCHEYLMNAWMM